MQIYNKKALLERTTEGDIISQYVRDFKGKSGTFKNPITPDEKEGSLSIYPHKDGKGWFLKSHNTGHEAGDVFQFVADLKSLNSKTEFPAIVEAIAGDMYLDLSKPAPTVKQVPAAHKAAPAAKTTPGKGILEIKTLPEFTEDFLGYWSHWRITPEILKVYQVQQVSSSQDSKGQNFNYNEKKAALFTVGGWEKIIVPPAAPGGRKYVFQNTGPAPYLFGLEQAQQSAADTVILCEGEKDLLVLAANGFAAVTLASATDRIKPEQTEAIKAAAGSRAVFIIYDNDTNGKKGAGANAALSGFPVASIPEDYNDIADFFAAGHTAEELRALLIQDDDRAGEKKKPEGCAKETPAAEIAHLYELRKDREGNTTDIKIKANKLLELLKSFGFGRYDPPGEGNKLIHKRDNVIKTVTSVEIADTFFKWLEAGPDTVNGYPKEKILNKFIEGQDTYFSEKRLYRLGIEEINFRTDSQDEIFFFFENGFVICTAKGWNFHQYNELKGNIWESQIIGRRQENNRTIPGPSIGILEPIAEPWKRGIVAQFLFNLCGKDTGRFLEFSTIIGYLLHNYFEVRRYAVLLTDSSLDNGDNGRTGKSLLSKLLEYLKPTAFIDGKVFKADNKFQFQEVKPGTQIVVINDLSKGFSFEQLYNAITEGVTVERKNQNPYLQQCKILLTTNAPVKVDGASGRDRIAELEVSDHYSDTHSVTDDFPGKWFLSPNTGLFSPQDWNEYFNLFFNCCSNFLREGVKKPEQINLNRRKLKEETPEGFPEWLDDQLEQGKIKIGDWVNCSTINNNFLNDFPDFKTHKYWQQQRNLRAAISAYIRFSGRFAPLEDKRNRKRNNGEYSLIFELK